MQLGRQKKWGWVEGESTYSDSEEEGKCRERLRGEGRKGQREEGSREIERYRKR